jgi:RNA polymerase sigma-70 factor (ECF subfamily)
MGSQGLSVAPFPYSTISGRGASQLNPVSIEETVLVERCKAGDSHAWDELVGKYEKPIYKLAYTLCHNHDQASDIVSQVFIRVFQSIHTFEGGREFRSWVFRVTHNVFIDLCIRRSHRHDVSLDAFANDSEDGTYLDRVADQPSSLPYDACLRAENDRLITAAINALPAHQRTVVEMHHFNDMRYEEIAARLHVSVGTVKSRLHRARRTLRKTADLN